MRYALYVFAVLCALVVVEWRGIPLVPQASHVVIPASVRSSPGGYRSYHFWHSGFQGGK